MKRNGWQLLAGAVLAAILSGACVAPLNPGNDDAVEYDAQGRRLITIAVDLESDARAVNTPVARTYIDFYEVVFELDGSSPVEYYSATASKGAGKRLSLRVPVGNYKGYLNAGHVGDDGEAVLLAQAAVTTAQPASSAWTFTLAALNLKFKGASPSATSDPIYVSVSNSGLNIKTTSGGIPYYEPTGGATVDVAVTTGVTNIAAYGADNIAVIPLIRNSDKPPVTIAINSSPAFSSGKLTFSFAAPTGVVGVSNIGFDVEAAAVSADKRTNGKAPVRWHIRNGLTVDAYDNGADDVTNTGAGLVFAFGGAKPTAQDEYEISVVPPVVP